MYKMFKSIRDYEACCRLIADELELILIKEGDVYVARYKSNNEIAFLSRDIKIMYNALVSLI